MVKDGCSFVEEDIGWVEWWDGELGWEERGYGEMGRFEGYGVKGNGGDGVMGGERMKGGGIGRR